MQNIDSEEKSKGLRKEDQEFVKREEVDNAIESEVLEKREESAQAEADYQKIREKIESIQVDDDVKMQAQAHANDLQSLESKEKIEKLLHVARQKGVIFAVAVAKKMNDPYILDTFHDALANQGHYREFKI